MISNQLMNPFNSKSSGKEFFLWKGRKKEKEGERIWNRSECFTVRLLVFEKMCVSSVSCILNQNQFFFLFSLFFFFLSLFFFSVSCNWIWLPIQIQLVCHWLGNISRPLRVSRIGRDKKEEREGKKEERQMKSRFESNWFWQSPLGIVIYCFFSFLRFKYNFSYFITLLLLLEYSSLRIGIPEEFQGWSSNITQGEKNRKEWEDE